MSRQSIQAGKAVIVIDLADQATAKFSGLVKSMSAKMMQASRSMRDTALNSTAGFIVTKMAVGSLVKDFVSFEDKILNLTAKMGFFGNKTAAQTATIADLRNHIMYLGRTTAFTSQEVADAAISLAQAGFSADELKASLKGTLDFARGTNYALGESADMVANLVRTFDLFGANDTLEQRVSKITSLTSQLVKTTRLGTVEIQDLRESLKYAGGSANNLGIELPVLLGFLTQMSESGLKASLAGTSLNTALLNMIKSSAKLKEIAPNFQIITDTQGNENLVATMYELFKISNRMSKVQRAAFFQDIFNIRGARATSAVQEMDRVDKFIKQIQNAGAESALAASLMESGAGGAIRRLTSAFETLRITIFELYAKEFTAFTNGLAYLTTIAETATVKYKGLILAFLLSPVIFGTTAIGAITLSFVLARLARALQLVATAGRGLKFLGGSLLSAAKGTATQLMSVSQRKPSVVSVEMKAYERQKAKVSKLQARVDASYARAGVLKSAAAQQRAQSRIASSVTMRNLVSEGLKMQQMRDKIAKRQNAVTSVKGLGNAIGQRLQTAKETAFYKERQKRYTLHANKMRRNYQYQATLAKAAQQRGFTQQAQQYRQAAAKSKQAMQASQARAAKAASLGKASRTTGMFQGLGVMGRSLAVGGKGVLSLAVGFAKLTASVTRFVFSWNFVGMVFNILLMFGDKIPSVVAAFNALGTGISGAFGEIGKVFAYAAPAMKLFQLAFNAFLQGDTGTGVAALQTAFSGIVDIIGNQLVAAWNTFMEHVGYLWTTLQQVFMSIKNIIMSIFEGITKIFGVVASPIFSSLQDIFGAATGGAAGGGLQSFAMKFVQGLDYFITRFFQGAIFLHQQLMEFVAEFQRVIGQIISEIPGTGQSGAAIQRDAQTTKSMAEMRSSMARGSLESSMKQRQKDLANIFSIDTAANARQRNIAAGQANARSSQTSVDMVHAMTVLSDQFAQNMRDRTDEINRLQQGKPTTPGQPGQGVADQLTRDLPKYLQALSGGVMSTRAIYRVDTKRQEDIMKDQLKAQQETNRLLSLGGGVP